MKSMRSSILIIFIVLLIATLYGCNQKSFEDRYNIPAPSPRVNPPFETITYATNYKEYYDGPDTITLAINDNFPKKDNYLFLDPHTISTPEEVQLAHALFSGLTTLETKTGKPIPALAHSWKIIKLRNGYTYVFTIREAYWSNGTPIEAEQIRASLLRAISPYRKNPLAATLALSIRGASELYFLPKDTPTPIVRSIQNSVQINAINSNTLYITTTNKGTNLLKELAHPIAAALPIVSPQIQDTSFLTMNTDSWIGSGPYIPTFVDDTTTILNVRQDFWSTPWINTIIISLQSSLEQALYNYQTQAVDWILLPPQTPMSILQDTLTTPERTSSSSSLQTIPFTSQVILEIPELSPLRTLLLPEEILETIAIDPDSLNYNTALSDIQYRQLHTVLLYIATFIIDKLKTYHTHTGTATLHNTNSFFLPHSSIAYLPKQEEMPSPDENIPDSTLDIPDEILEAELANKEKDIVEKTDSPSVSDIDIDMTIEEYSKLLQEYLSSSYTTHNVLRIGYTHIFLLPYAQYLANIFNEYNVRTEVVRIPSLITPETHRYDIALRTISVTSDTLLGYISQLWWIWAGGAESPKRILGDIASIMDILLYTDNSQDYFSQLHTLLDDFTNTVRFIPIWNMGTQEIIIEQQYPWWKSQMTWHPLYH